MAHSMGPVDCRASIHHPTRSGGSKLLYELFPREPEVDPHPKPVQRTLHQSPTVDDGNPA